MCNWVYLHSPGPTKADSHPHIYQHEHYGHLRNTCLDIRVRQLQASCGDLESITVGWRLAKYHPLSEAFN